MVFRRYEAASLETLANAEVWDIELPESGFLSAILLGIRATNGSTSNKEGWPHKLVDEIAVKDGSKVIHSLTGGLEQAVAALDTKKLPQDFYTEGPSLYQRGYFPVMFGRYLRDPMYGLNLATLKNPKLFMDFDIEAIGDIADTTYTTGSGKITVVFVIDDAPPVMPAKYIRKTVIEKFTQGTSGDKTVHMPVENPYRAIIVQPLIDDYEVDSLITNVKLNFDSGKFIPLDEKTDAYIRSMAWAYGFEREAAIELLSADGETKALPDTNIRSITGLIGGGASNDVLTIIGGANGGFQVSIKEDEAAAQATERPLQLIYKTNAPRWCMFFPFGSPLLEDNFLPAQLYGKADLVLTQAGAESTCRVALEEIAPN